MVYSHLFKNISPLSMLLCISPLFGSPNYIVLWPKQQYLSRYLKNGIFTLPLLNFGCTKHMAQ